MSDSTGRIGRRAHILRSFGSLDPARIEVSLRVQRSACLRLLFRDLGADIAALVRPGAVRARWLPLLTRRIR